MTPDGQSLDLVRQLDGIKTKEVRDRLQPIRADLQTEGEALQLSRDDRNRVSDRDQPTPEQSDKSRELSDSQDMTAAMLSHVKQEVKTEKEPPKSYSYGFKIEQPPSLPRQPEEKMQSDKSPELSDSQDAAAAMLQHYRQQQREQQEHKRKAQEMRQQAREQTKAANDNNLTDPAAEMLERYRQRQRERGQNRDGPEY